MRTTLTLDPEVAALVRKEIKERGVSLKKVINKAIKDGLLKANRQSNLPKYKTKPHSAGRILRETVNIGELLSELDENKS